MIKYCLEKWNKNKEKLREVLSASTTLESCTYEDLLRLIITNVLNDEDNDYDDMWDANKITVIDDGDYQGTLLFLFPNNSYQPTECEYLMTYVGYGSCSGCDTLQSIQMSVDCGQVPSKRSVEDFMNLCKDIVCNTIKPYNSGWRNKIIFEGVE